MIDLQNSNCVKCGLCKTRRRVINGQGSLTAKILLIGDNPNDADDKAGRSLNGYHGAMLGHILEAAEIDSADIYYTTVVRCIPKAPPNPKFPHSKWVQTREPSQEEVDACLPYLEAEINTIKPNVIVPMGNLALRAIVKEKKCTIGDYRGKEFWSDKYSCKIIPTYNPGSFSRTPQHELLTIEDFRKIKTSSNYKELTKPAETNYVIADTMELLESAAKRLIEVPEFSFDIETTGFNPRKDKILCISFTWKEKTAVIVPLIKYVGKTEEYTEIIQKPTKKKINGEWVNTGFKDVPKLCSRTIDEYLPFWGDKQAYVMEKLKEVMESDASKIAQNGKFDIKFLYHNGIKVKNYDFDTMLAAYLLNENAVGVNGLKELSVIHTDMGAYDEDLDKWFEDHDIPAKSRNYAHLPFYEMLLPYCGKDSDCTYRLKQIFHKRLEKEGMLEFLQRLMMPLSDTLMQAEIEGILIDMDYLQILKKELTDQAESVKTSVFDLIRNMNKYSAEELADFNILSTKQLKDLLFIKLRLPATKKTKKGGDSTDEEVLNDLAKLHPIPNKIVEYRKIQKLLGTYVIGMEDLVDEFNYVHTSFMMHIATTGRLSSVGPNLQNIPRDDKRPKNLFIARPGFMFIESDYAQAEFRYWANYSQDPAMIRDITAATNGTGPDTHKKTASLAFGVPIDEVTPKQRQDAKTVVFGIIFGQQAESLAEQLGMTIIQAQRIIDTFFAQYPIAKLWLDEAVKTARTYGTIRNIFGRLRHVPGMNSPDIMVRSDAERKAKNSPIQSAASDMNCNAANRIRARLKEEHYGGSLKILVHDSLLFEVPEAEFKQTLEIIQEEMERPFPGLIVPMKAEFKVGNRWGSLTEVEKKSNVWSTVVKVDGKKEHKPLNFNEIKELVKC